MAAELRVLTPARVAGRAMPVAAGVKMLLAVGAVLRGVAGPRILLALVAVAAVLPAHAAGGGDAMAARDATVAPGATGMTDPVTEDITVQRFAAARVVAGAGERGLVVMLRDRLEIDDELSRPAFSADELTRYSAIAGLELVAAELKRDGAQVLKLPAGTTEERLAEVLSALRWQPEVLYAERHDFPAPGARAVAPPLPAGPSVTALMVKLRDPALRALSDANQPLPVEQMAMLSALAGVELGFVRAMSGGAFVVSLPEPLSPTEAAAIAARVAANPAVTWADPDDHAEAMFVPNDPGYYPEQWHYWGASGGIRAPEAWDVTRGSTTIRVAVLDTGILPNHPDFTGRLLPGYDMVSNLDSRSGDGDGRDSDPSDPGDWGPAGWCGPGEPATNSSWHGSHVAGTIGARSNEGYGVAGINWESKIVPVRVLGDCGGDSAGIADGIRWAAGLAVSGLPLNPNPARVLNLSLGAVGACPTVYQEAINAAVASGAVIVVSAGNDGENMAAVPYRPASCHGVVTVHATDPGGQHAAYSNFGSDIEISAPGGAGFADSPEFDVYSTVSSSTKAPGAAAWAFYPGTSMAAPHVAGVASLVLSRNSEITSAQVTALLQNTARSFPQWGDIWDCAPVVCGAGIVNAYAAVMAAGTPTPTPTPTPVPATPTPVATPPAALALVSPVAVRCGTSNTLTGSGFSPGSVVKAFIAFPTGVQAVGPFTPTSIASTSLTWTLPCSSGLGNGFIALQVINTDQGYISSNIVPALLRAGTSAGYPSITGVNGVSVTAAHASFPLAHVQTVVAKGSTITINGTGFAVPAKVNLFSASGNVGPLETLPGSTFTALLVQIPLAAPTGPGALQVVNPTGSWPASNAVSVPLGASISITSITQVGSTITVNGSGFSSLSVINFFTPSANHCGMAGGGAVCPLTLVSDQQFTLQRPAGASAGRAFIEVLNPPFIPFSSTGTDPDGAFTLP